MHQVHTCSPCPTTYTYILIFDQPSQRYTRALATFLSIADSCGLLLKQGSLGSCYPEK
ncbi:hypothetical protein JMJ77_0002281, partial [Colletotrichum scovillei]